MTMRNLDPELVDVVAATPPMDISDLSVARAVAGDPDEMPVYDGVELNIIYVPGLRGAPDIPVRMMRPSAATGPLPLLIAMHGGGYVLGNARDFDWFCVDVVRGAGIAVANVDYRLAPEAPFPAAVDDCMAVLAHMHDHADALGVDARRLAIGGSSAGGGLAAATTLRARDEGSPPIRFQTLLSPALDDRRSTASYTTLSNPPILTPRVGDQVWSYYLGPERSGAEKAEVSPYAAAARAADLSGLPPAYIAAMELDPVRDDNILYAMRLLNAGVSVELHCHPGTFHGSLELAPEAASSARIREGLIDALRRRFPLEESSP
jgi:acetyl esterase/lipase